MTFTREGADDVSTSSAPTNPTLQRTNASVAARPPAFAAGCPYRSAIGVQEARRGSSDPAAPARVKAPDGVYPQLGPHQHRASPHADRRRSRFLRRIGAALPSQRFPSDSSSPLKNVSAAAYRPGMSRLLASASPNTALERARHCCCIPYTANPQHRCRRAPLSLGTLENAPEDDQASRSTGS